MSEGAFWQSLSRWSYGLSSLVTIAGEVAILVAITTIVRRHRPDAYRGLQLWAILSLVLLVVLTGARVVVPMVTTRDGMESYFRSTVILTIVGVASHVVLVVLFIRGLTALAQPPKPVTVEGGPPYR